MRQAPDWGRSDGAGACATIVRMPGKVRTAEELEQMSPAEQDAAFASSTVTDLDDVSREFVQRVRSRVEDRNARIDTPHTK